MANEDESAANTEYRKPSPSKWSRKWSIHPLALVAIVLGSLAVGAFVVNLASPSDSTVAADGTHVLTSTDRLAAAEQWFQRPATAEDTFPAVGNVPGLQPSSTRRVTGDQAYLKVWIGKTDKNELCLLGTQDSSEVTFSKCVTAGDFSLGGIRLGLNRYQVSWDGNSITTVLNPSKN